MLASAAGSADFYADTEMIRPNLTGIEQASKQRVLRPRDRMQRAGAVEGVGECLALGLGLATAPVLDLESAWNIGSGHNPPRDDLEPPVGDHSSDRRSHFRRNPVTVHVPPGPGVPKEAMLLVRIEALPDRVTIRAQAVHGSAPTHIRAT